MDWGDWRVLASLAVIMAWSGLAFLLGKPKHPVAWGIFLSGVMFVLVSNLFFPIGVTMAERLVFSPSLGFAVAIGYALYQHSYEKAPILFFSALAVAMSFYVYKTGARLPVWESNDTLHASGIHSAPRSARAVGFYGKYLMKQAIAHQNPQERQRLGEEAVEHFKTAVDIVPSFRDAYQNMGVCYLEALQAPEKALPAFEQVLAISPGYGYALAGKAAAYLRMGDNMKALEFMEEAYEHSPENQTIINNYVNVLLKIRDAHRSAGDIPTAIEYDKQVKRLRGEL